MSSFGGKKSEGKLTLYIRAYLRRPVSMYYVQKINNEQVFSLKLTEPIEFDFTSHLGRNAMGQICKTDYGHLISFDFFAEGAN